MARHTTLAIPSQTWTEITANDTTYFTFQNLSPLSLQLQITDGSVQPTSEAGSLVYTQYEGERGAWPGDLAPGLTSSNYRLWVYADTVAEVYISHD